MPGRGAVSGCYPSGWLWLDDLGDAVNCFVLFYLFIYLFIFLLKIHGDCWQGAGMVKSSLLDSY